MRFGVSIGMSVTKYRGLLERGDFDSLSSRPTFRRPYYW